MYFGKKGANLSIMALVIIALALSGIALFTFMTIEPVQKNINRVAILDNVYSKQEKINYYLKETGDLRGIDNEFENKNEDIRIDKEEGRIKITKNKDDISISYSFPIKYPFYYFRKKYVSNIGDLEINEKVPVVYYGENELDIILYDNKVISGEEEVGSFYEIDNKKFVSVFEYNNEHLKKIEDSYGKYSGCPIPYLAKIGYLEGEDIIVSFGEQEVRTSLILKGDKIYLDCRFSQSDIEVGSIDNEVDINKNFFKLDSEIMQRIRFKYYFDIKELVEYLALLEGSRVVRDERILCKKGEEESKIIPDWPKNEDKSINLEVNDLNLKSENGEVRIDFSGIKFVQGSNIDYLYLEKLKDDDFLPKEVIIAKSNNDYLVLAFYPDDSVWLTNERYYNLHGFMKSGEWKDLEKKDRNYVFSKFRSESNVIVDYDKLSELFDQLSQ